MSLEREKEAQSGLESSGILETLKSMANPERTAGMNKYGTNIERAPEISMLWLRQKAIRLGKNHSRGQFTVSNNQSGLATLTWCEVLEEALSNCFPNVSADHTLVAS
jgi:hypothetical protein